MGNRYEALANINESALPQDRVTGEGLRKKVQWEEGAIKRSIGKEFPNRKTDGAKLVPKRKKHLEPKP